MKYSWSSNIGALIAALRIFIATHGKCAYIYSENVMSLILAQQEI
jgi:hypothetical protein